MTLVCVSHLRLQNGGFLDYYPLCLITHNHGLDSNSLWVALFQQNYKNTSTQQLPLPLFAKDLLQAKTLFLYLTSPCHTLMSMQWRFVVLCVWKCSLMSTTQLVCLFLYNTMWVRFSLSNSFQFLTSMSSMGEKYLHKWIKGFLTNWKHMKNVEMSSSTRADIHDVPQWPFYFDWRA